MKGKGLTLIMLTVLPLSGLFVVAVLLVLGPWPAEPVWAGSGVHYVAPGAVCGVPTPCYGSVQAAVDAAVPGDEIRVAAGTYTGVSVRAGLTQTVYISKNVSILGGYTIANWTSPDSTANVSALDAQGQGRVLYITGSISPTIEGLHLIGGDAAGLGGGMGNDDSGGAVYLSQASALIRNCAIVSSTAYNGGGLYAESTAARLYGNTFAGNSALSYGGGFVLEYSSAKLTSNVIASNTAGSGGGALLYWDASTLDSNTFSGNVSQGDGGALYLQGGRGVLMSNIITGNRSAYGGGGLILVNTSSLIAANSIISNAAEAKGGGLYVVWGAPLLANNVVADNRVADTGSGGGLCIVQASPRLVHTTVARNRGGAGAAIYVEAYESSFSHVTMTNTVLVDHTVGISVTAGNTATLNSVLWYGTPVTISRAATASVTVLNETQGDPAFGPDGSHLTAGSAAIDRGVGGGLFTDIDRQPRLGSPDLGVDEYWAPGALKVVLLPMVVRH